MPNFVDCAFFRPVQSLAEKQTIRRLLGIPEDAFVVGCVAAVKKDHKRIDHLIQEFSQWAVDSGQWAVGSGQLAVNSKEITASSLSTAHCQLPTIPSSLPTVHCPLPTDYLLIAGAKTSETAELLALAESLIPGRYKIVTDCSRSQMPDLYRAMDVFVLTSLFEMMPIALLEALASGLPCVVNKHPVLEWMIGAGGADQLSVNGYKLFVNSPNNHEQITNNPAVGGMTIDMNREGALTEALAGLSLEWIEFHGRQARARAVKLFSTEAVIGQYVEYYKEIVRGERRGVPRRQQTTDHRPQT